MVDGSFRVLQASATTKTGRHDITELLLKVALNTNKSIKSKYEFCIIRGVQCANFRRFRVSYQVTNVRIKRTMCWLRGSDWVSECSWLRRSVWMSGMCWLRGSNWVSDCSCQRSKFCLAISWREKVTFKWGYDEDKYYTNRLSCIVLVVLAHYVNGAVVIVTAW